MRQKFHPPLSLIFALQNNTSGVGPPLGQVLKTYFQLLEKIINITQIHLTSYKKE